VDLIDLRSDTVTRPDDAMRRAMADAVVGDDVYGEDPTVRALEELGAEMLGTEASLYVPSGTMGNQIALHLHGRPGTEVVCEASSHILHFEMGAMAALSGLLPRAIAAPRGLLAAAAVEEAIVPAGSLRGRTGLLAVENTANMAGGTVYDRGRLEALLAVARRHGLPVHLDGARIFNAAVALGVSARGLAAGFDSVMVSLSKGLGAPVGSLLCGAADFIREARRVRKMLGGGMRQAGIIAAAGILALRDGPGRLAADHENAAHLAAAVAAHPELEVDPAVVETNIVIAAVRGAAAPGEDPAAGFLSRLREAGVLATLVDRRRVRWVTHRDAPRPAIEEAIRRLSATTRG
jgi:threonine aldolase